MGIKKSNLFSKKNRPFIIAEIASSHYGLKKNILKLAKASAKFKFDAVKFQIYNTKNFVSKFNPSYKVLQKIEIDYTKWKKIITELKNTKINYIAEIFDYETLIFCENLNFFDTYKISASCVYEKKIIEKILTLNKNTIIAVGGMNFTEIKSVHSRFLKEKNNHCIMIGHQNFPTNLSDLNLNKIKYLKDRLNCSIGFADHVNAAQKLSSFSIPLLAYSLGADVIEKHINIDRKFKKNDYYSSLNINELEEFIEFMHSNSQALGESNYKISKSEIKYNIFSKKYLVAKYDIEIGEKINNKNTSFKRVNKIGINEREFSKYKNKVTKKKIKQDQILYKENLI